MELPEYEKEKLAKLRPYGATSIDSMTEVGPLGHVDMSRVNTDYVDDLFAMKELEENTPLGQVMYKRNLVRQIYNEEKAGNLPDLTKSRFGPRNKDAIPKGRTLKDKKPRLEKVYKPDTPNRTGEWTRTVSVEDLEEILDHAEKNRTRTSKGMKAVPLKPRRKNVPDAEVEAYNAAIKAANKQGNFTGIPSDRAPYTAPSKPPKIPVTPEDPFREPMIRIHSTHHDSGKILPAGPVQYKGTEVSTTNILAGDAIQHIGRKNVDALVDRGGDISDRGWKTLVERSRPEMTTRKGEWMLASEASRKTAPIIKTPAKTSAKTPAVTQGFDSPKQALEATPPKARAGKVTVSPSEAGDVYSAKRQAFRKSLPRQLPQVEKRWREIWNLGHPEISQKGRVREFQHLQLFKRNVLGMNDLSDLKTGANIPAWNTLTKEQQNIFSEIMATLRKKYPIG
jgi:hypothetical protein